MKVKTAALEKEGYYETELKETSELVHNKIICSIEKNILLINFQTNYLIIQDNQKELGGESSAIFGFELTKNKKLVFKTLSLAG